jgi:hypothetical protein
MRKMILMAVAGFLWKKFKARNATVRPGTPVTPVAPARRW